MVNWNLVLGLVAGAGVIVFVLAMVWWASQNTLTLITAGGAIVLLGVIGIAFWYFFIYHPPLQINKQMAKNFRESAKFAAQAIQEACPGGVWMRGTSRGPGGYFIGDAVGYTSERLVATLGGRKAFSRENNVLIAKQEGGIEADVLVHCVYAKRKTLPLLGWLSPEKPILFYDWKPKGAPDSEWHASHDAFAGELRLHGNVPVRVSEFFWLDSQVDDPFVDEFLSMKGKNIVTHDILNDVSIFVKLGIQGNPSHQMEMEKSKMLDVGGPMGGMQRPVVEG